MLNSGSRFFITLLAPPVPHLKLYIFQLNFYSKCYVLRLRLVPAMALNVTLAISVFAEVCYALMASVVCDPRDQLCIAWALMSVILNKRITFLNVNLG